MPITPAPPEAKKFQEIRIDSVEDLIQHLTLQILEFRGITINKNNNKSSPWIFRGHWDSSWQLMPSAFRPNAFEKFRKIEDPTKKQNILDAEYHVLMDFIEEANINGVCPIYDMNLYEFKKEYPPFKGNLEKYKAEQEKYLETFPPQNILPYICLAQHHGIPTRLLDFTLDPLYATYFAAQSFFDPRANNPEMMAIYAIETDSMLLHQRTKNHKFIDLVYDNYHHNSFIKSQKGCFLIDRERNQLKGNDFLTKTYCERLLENDQNTNIFYAKGENTEFSTSNDEILVGRIPSFKKDSLKATQKILFPQEKAKNLLLYLDKRNINIGSIMPSLDNIKKTLEHRRILYSA